VFSNAVLHWLKDADRVIRNVFRALRPGGVSLRNAAATNAADNSDGAHHGARGTRL